jgi:NAD(P)-dependent dehydrogenase (short-subunit alcohol dehydrogenase family)
MNIDLALVTGAGRGIGRSIAQNIGKAGIPVVCISKTDACAATAKNISDQGGSAEALRLDISDLEHCEKTIFNLISRKQPKRIGIVLAAAILGPPGGLMNGPPLRQWEELYRTNVLGNLAVLKGCLPKMHETKFGRVIALAGGGSGYAYAEFSAYALTKIAMVRAIENLDVELSGAGDFAFVVLAPGAIETDMLKQVKAGGGIVLTPASIEEPMRFASAFFSKDARKLSGRFLHVRDEWMSYMDDPKLELPPDSLKLRRVK